METRGHTTRGAATRDRIVRAAAESIADLGVDAMRLDHVLDAAGVSKGQLYHYFEDRDELVRAAVVETGNALLETQADMMAALDTFAGIERWFDCLVELQVDLDARGGCPLASLTAALADRDDVARSSLVRAFDAWEERLRAGLAAMHAGGVLSTESDPAVLATATMASVQGGLVLTQVRRDPAQLRIALDAALDHLRAARADGH